MNQIFNTLIFIIFGLIVGSFLNVVILRFDALASAITGRSHCPHCKRNLIWYELIPVLSYIALQGKCRTCKKPISIQYPLVELATGLIFGLIYLQFGLTNIETYFLLAIAAILIVIFVYDMVKLEISDWLVLIAAGLWLIYLAITLQFSFASYLPFLYGALALGGFLGLMVLISREKWMGAGDIGLGALLGFMIGWPQVLLSSFSAFSLGALVGIILIIFKVSKIKDQLAFAPFLILGFFITLFWGNQILNWYGQLMVK